MEMNKVFSVLIPAVATVLAAAITWLLNYTRDSKEIRNLKIFKKKLEVYGDLISSSKNEVSIAKLESLKEEEIARAVEYAENILLPSSYNEADLESYESDMRHRLLLFIPKQPYRIVWHFLFYIFVFSAIGILAFFRYDGRFMIAALYSIIAIALQQLTTKNTKRIQSPRWLVIQVLVCGAITNTLANTGWTLFALNAMYVAIIIAFFLGFITVTTSTYSFRIKLGLFPVVVAAIFLVALALTVIIPLGIFMVPISISIQ